LGGKSAFSKRVAPKPQWSCPQMPLTDTQIRNAKPGLRPVRQSGEGEKDKRSPSKGQEKAKCKVVVE
jgi:hypothetical protein